MEKFIMKALSFYHELFALTEVDYYAMDQSVQGIIWLLFVFCILIPYLYSFQVILLPKGGGKVEKLPLYFVIWQN